MKVVATKTGYHGKIRQPGDEFDVPDKSKASWFEPVGGKKVRSKGEAEAPDAEPAEAGQE